MFVDKRAKARHRVFQHVAKTLRDEAASKGQRIQTNLRTGRTNCLLQIRKFGNNTPCSNIPPTKIVQKLPSFEIGLYKDIFNMSLSSSEEEQDNDMEDEDPEDEEDLQIIQNYMVTEMKQDEKKRIRENTSDEKTSRYTKIKSTPHSKARGQNKEELPESSSDEEKSDRQVRLFSTTGNFNVQPTPEQTMVPETLARRNNIRDKDSDTEMTSVQDTPYNPKMNTRSKSSIRLENE